MNTKLQNINSFIVSLLFGIFVKKNNGALTSTVFDYDESYHVGPCNVWRPGDPDLNTFDLIRNYKLDQYHEELVHRIAGSNYFQTAFHIERSANLTIESIQAFPRGVPHEFSFECTFRTKKPPTRPWHLFYLSDYNYSSQLSMTVNPLYGTIDFALPLYDGTLYTVSFVESRVFNGMWHKVMLGLTQNSVRLWIDCKPSRDEYGRERVPLDNRAYIDINNGYFTLAQDVRSGITVPIDLQWMVLSCDSDKPNRTTCEELPQYDLKFKEPDEVEPESEEEHPILMASAGRPRTCPETCPAGPPGRDGAPGPPGPPGINASPLPNTSALRGDKGQKGDMGLPGFDGLHGRKGEPGEITTSGFLKEFLEEFYEESRGLKGDKGESGINKESLDSFVEMLKGAKGEPGEYGLNGIPGPPGLKGRKGDSGSKLDAASLQMIENNIIDNILGRKESICCHKQPDQIENLKNKQVEKGEKGEPGEPGSPGISGLPGQPGMQGQPGLCSCEQNISPGKTGPPGEKGNNGPQGLPGHQGLPGYPGPPGPPGPPGMPGQAGLPGITKEGFQFEETEIRDICMSVVREYIEEIKSTLIGPPGAAGRSIPGKMGRPGSRGPPGEPGPQGPRGERGFIGPPGLAGPKGQMGLQGLDGIKGDKGDDGIGRQGPPGPQGPPGIDGAPGLDGKAGRPGDRGDSGIPGITGPQGPPGQPGVCSPCPYLSYPQFYQQQQSKGPQNNKG